MDTCNEWISGNAIPYLTAASVTLLAVGFAVIQFCVRDVPCDFEKSVRFVVALTLCELAVPLAFGLVVLAPGFHHQWAGAVALLLILPIALLQAHDFLAKKWVSVPRKDMTQAYKFLYVQTLLVVLPIASCVMLVLPVPMGVKYGACLWLLFSGTAEAFVLTSRSLGPYAERDA